MEYANERRHSNQEERQFSGHILLKMTTIQLEFSTLHSEEGNKSVNNSFEIPNYELES